MKNAVYFVDGIKDYLIHELWNLNADIIDAAEEGDLIRRDVVFTEIDALDKRASLVERRLKERSIKK